MTDKKNTGDYNTGNFNTGYRNTGNFNTGDRNTGNFNTGDRNTGYRNTGNFNTGDRNTGDYNTGYRNTGDYNTGYLNTGYRNTGDYNTGCRNTGDWNTGDYNTGYCNSVTLEDCLIFNKPAKRIDWENAVKPYWMYAELTQWVKEEDMTDKEKEDYPSYVTTGGYLKCYPSLHHAYKDAWEKASEEDKVLTFKLPNYDREVFKEVFGFDPEIDKKHIVTIDGKDIELSKSSFDKLKKQLMEDKDDTTTQF